MDPLTKAFVGSAVRWLVTVAATHGVALGDDQATQIASGLVGLVTLGWSLWHKLKADQAIQKAKRDAEK